MTLEAFIRAMPKVELHVHLEGAVARETLLIIAEQNEISETMKHFSQWVNLLKKPDFARLDEIIAVTSSWMQQPEDLTHAVYELGVALAKQNVRYAEVTVSPTIYTENGFTFDDFLSAINDGRVRAQRAWGIQMAWVLNISRSQPRTSDEIGRWATSASSRKGGVIGIALSGREDAQPVGQFERAFRTVAKKELLTVVEAGDKLGLHGIQEVIQVLEPSRLVCGPAATELGELLDLLIEKHTVLNVGLTRALRMGQVMKYADYPLRRLYDEGLTLTLSCDKPVLYGSSLNDEYLAAATHCGLTLEELETIAMNAVQASQLMPSEKEEMFSAFKQEYARLRAEFVPS